MKLHRRNKNRRHPRPAIVRAVEDLATANNDTVGVVRRLGRWQHEAVDIVNALCARVHDLEKVTSIMGRPGCPQERN
jgi:hypothetical protein